MAILAATIPILAATIPQRVEESRREESREEAERGATASTAPATPPALFAPASPMDSAYDYFRNYINPSAPNRDFEELAEFVRFFNEHGGEGNAVAIYACQIAQSKRAFKWAFIRTVLNGWKCAGVYTLAQCEAHERDWKARRPTGGTDAANPAQTRKTVPTAEDYGGDENFRL